MCMNKLKQVIQHARAAQVPLVIAVNKCDLPDADPQRVLEELQMHGVVVEELVSLLCVAVCCSVLQCVAVRCGVLQCGAVRCVVLQRGFLDARCCRWRAGFVAVCCSVLHCVAVRYSRCMAWLLKSWSCCSVLQCVAARYSRATCSHSASRTYISHVYPTYSTHVYTYIRSHANKHTHTFVLTKGGHV